MAVTQDLWMIVAMLEMLLECIEALPDDDDSTMRLSARIERFLPRATEMVIRRMTSEIRQLEALLGVATGQREDRPSQEFMTRAIKAGENEADI